MLLIVLAYLGGALTILSPCILPVLPFVFARADQPFVRSGLPLLAGMSVTFALVATLAAVGGGWVAQANQYGRWLAIVLLAVFGLTLLLLNVVEQIAMARRKGELSENPEVSETFEKFVEEMVKKHPLLEQVLGPGFRIANPFKPQAVEAAGESLGRQALPDQVPLPGSRTRQDATRDAQHQFADADRLRNRRRERLFPARRRAGRIQAVPGRRRRADAGQKLAHAQTYSRATSTCRCRYRRKPRSAIS